MLNVRLSDGTVRQCESPTRVTDVLNAGSTGTNSPKEGRGRPIAAVLDGKTVGLDAPLPTTGTVELEPLYAGDARALPVMRHSAAHVMARAVMRLFEGVELAFGPTVGEGFYYDMRASRPITDEDLPAIEAEMKRIIEADEAFERVEVPREKAVEIVRGLNQPLKAEHIETGLAAHPSLSFYRQGEFVDLCRGPHVPGPGCIGAFKLTNIAGAYWKGDANNAQLQRLYGTAWFSQADLDAHLAALEEARRRDHRVLGKQLDLFTTSPLVGSGLVLWMPKGAILRGTLESFVREELAARGYQPVYTPHIGKVDLYKISGHYPYYADSQFKPIVMSDDEQYLLKPMNCPHHTMIYKARPHSYKDLPLRLAEFGTVYRYEQSGELGGMTRVRGFTQDDAHIFCSEEQIESETIRFCELLGSIYKDLGFPDYFVKFSDRPPVRAGSDAVWDQAEGALKAASKAAGLELILNPGEGAFYGPKLEFVLRDAIGRDWQCGTLQVDFVLPERLDASYVAEDGSRRRPVMLHRAIFGSFERIIGILIENYAGRFPLWLAPTQAVVVTIVNDADSYAEEVAAALRAAGMRVDTDLRNEKINYKVREHSLAHVPLILAVGRRDMEARTVAIRRLGSEKQEVLELGAAVTTLSNEARPPF